MVMSVHNFIVESVLLSDFVGNQQMTEGNNSLDPRNPGGKDNKWSEDYCRVSEARKSRRIGREYPRIL
jgi:hypothetical protein